MLTIKQLRLYTEELQKKQGLPRPVSILSTNPILHNKTLTIKAQAQGTKLYPMVLTLYNVDYSIEKDGLHPLLVRPRFGESFYMSPASESENPVQVRCQCPFFRFAWAQWNLQEKALTGPAFTQYVRKTQTRAEVNPNHIPGVCKHLLGFFDRLNRDRILIP